MQKGTGTSVTAHKFEVWLAGIKCENYCVGFVRGPAATCEAAAKKFTDGSCWLLSKVSLDTYTTSAYISTPVAVRVDLGKSTVENAGTLSGVPQPAVHPVPPRTVADAGRINTNKCTDLLALVKSVFRERTSKTSVPIADVVLVDDSKVDGDALAAITMGVFGGAKIVILKEHVGQPMVFFNLSVSVANGSTNINHYADEVIIDAPESAKTFLLTMKQTDLAAADNTKSITTEFINAQRDVSGPCSISCAAFLDFTSENAHTVMPDVCQIMWVHLEEPEPDETVMTGPDAATQRVWFRTRLRDATGATVVGIRERAALMLTSCGSVDDFKDKHQTANLNWPLMCHVRLSRNVRDTTSRKYVNYMVEDVTPVSWSIPEAPNAAYSDLLRLLNMRPPHDECILFAFLSDIAEDQHYGYQVLYDGMQAPRSTYVLSLIASESKSTTTNIGEGFQVSTSKIHDVANPLAGASQPTSGDASSSAGASQLSYSMLGFCTLDHLSAFRLDPPRGKPTRCALCVISRREQDIFHILKLECLEPEQVTTAIDCIRKLRTLCKGIRPSSTEKRSHDVRVCADAMPTQVKKARTLQTVPTDKSMQ